MKSLMSLWLRVAEESATRCCTSTIRDWKTVSERSRCEGISFLTITLPAFGKDFERALSLGRVDRRLFLGFSRKAELPRFLGGFLDRVFDRSTGILLEEPCVDSILAVRQLTLMFGKIAFPCSDERVRAAMRGYVETEQQVKEADKQRTALDCDRFKRMSRLLFASALTRVDREIYYGLHVPKHGPGATADRLVGNQKYRQVSWPVRLERGGFNAADFLLPNYRYYGDLEDVHLLDPDAEQPVRVISVPKTLKTPRIIGVEPTAMQYAQQSVLMPLIHALTESETLGSLLGFLDQGPNQTMAQKGSVDGSLATLDLSDASDRVSNQLVCLLLSDHPHLLSAVDASRSRRADVQGHELQQLAKFASMGSALCFPVEAMVFLTCVFLGIEESLDTQLSRRDVFQFLGSVRIYGDDIIVPVEHVQAVIGSLERFGAKVNSTKSFWSGSFRESCGREYYAGEDVSIVRVRHDFPTSRQDASEVISLVSLRNQLYFAGYWRTVEWLDNRIRDLLKHFPVVLPTSPVLGRHSFLGYEAQRIGDKLHDPQVRGYVVSAQLPKNSLNGSAALLKCLLRSARNEDPDLEYYQAMDLVRDRWTGGLPTADVDHLERSGRPQQVLIKLRWSSAV